MISHLRTADRVYATFDRTTAPWVAAHVPVEEIAGWERHQFLWVEAAVWRWAGVTNPDLLEEVLGDSATNVIMIPSMVARYGYQEEELVFAMRGRQNEPSSPPSPPTWESQGFTPAECLAWETHHVLDPRIARLFHHFEMRPPECSAWSWLDYAADLVPVFVHYQMRPEEVRDWTSGTVYGETID